MFIFGIFGIQGKKKLVKEFGSMICACGRYTHMQLVEEYTYFHLFFIPLLKWNRKYYVEARCCGRIFEVPDDYKEEIMNTDIPDLNRLREIKPSIRICPGCGQQVESNYRYCPYCGREI